MRWHREVLGLQVLRLNRSTGMCAILNIEHVDDVFMNSFKQYLFLVHLS